MIPIDNVHMHSLAHHTRLTPYGLGVVVSHPDVVSLSVVGGLRGVSGALTTIRRRPVVRPTPMGKWPTLAAWYTASQRHNGPLLGAGIRAAMRASVQMWFWLACPITVPWCTSAHGLQKAHRKALQQCYGSGHGTITRNAMSNRTCCRGRGGRECLAKQYIFKGL